MAVPNKLVYGTKADSSMAESYRANIYPQNGAGSKYVPNEIITINIPTSNNNVLVPSESYLKLTTSVTTTATACDFARFESSGVHSLIQKIRIFHGGNLLSDIDDYYMLAKIMHDIK